MLKDLEQSLIQDLPLSPLSLKGNQEKWYYDKERLVVKAALFDGFIRWEDWKVEVLVSRLLPQFQIDVVEQQACRIDDGFGHLIYGCYSGDFRRPRERYFTFGRLFQERGLTDQFTGLSAVDKIQTAIRILSGYLGEQAAARFIEDMCLGDYILGNVDRHYDNFGILIRRDADNVVMEQRPAPFYDFGMGLFQNQKEGLGDDLEDAMESMLSSPFTIDLQGAYDYYREAWRLRCRGMRIKLTGLDFPKGPGKRYMLHCLSSLGIETEG
jgi:hypothetical protein